jgi:beta-glucosidase-like glycosyl hydrolase
MTGHIAAPQLAARYGASKTQALLPATISKALTTELLRKELKFDGIIVTDSLEMGGIRKVVHKPAELTRQVLAAGSDVLLMPPDPIETHATIWRSLDAGELEPEAIAASIDRVRQAVSKVMASDSPSVQETFSRTRTKELALKVAEKAIKTRGDVNSLRDATDIIILCSDRKADVERAEFCKATWQSMGINLAISVLSTSKGTSTEFPDNPIIVTFDRPHGVLGGTAHQNTIEDVIRKVLHALVRTGINPSGVILIGNPYLEKMFEQVMPGCGILTFSATEPSIIAVGNILKNAQ